MLLEKFSNIIDRSRIGTAIADRQKLIEHTDPKRIYVENIRSFFHIPHALAQWLCKEAVREGVFEERVGFLCPQCESLIADFASLKEATEMTCHPCEVLGEEKHSFSPSDCQQITFYRVIKNG